MKSIQIPFGGVQRHRGLRQLARAVYVVPGMRPVMRRAIRRAISQWPLSVTNKQRLYNFFARDVSPGGLVACEVRVDADRRLSLHLDLRDDLSRRWYYWGYAGYETATTALVARLLTSKRCVFDVGANVGYYALMAAAMLEGRGEVRAFEPWVDVFRSLQRNAARNSFTCLRLNNVALSDHDGRQTLFLPSDPTARSNASLIEDFTEQGDRASVTTVRLDTYCARHCAHPVDLVRIDVEGAETKVLRGMGDLLERWRPDVICEVLPPYENDINDFFKGTPYRKFLITDARLREVDRFVADAQFRDCYLSCAPMASAVPTP